MLLTDVLILNISLCCLMLGCIKLVKSLSLLSNISNSGPERNNAGHSHWSARNQSQCLPPGHVNCRPSHFSVQGFSAICFVIKFTKFPPYRGTLEVIRLSKDYFNFPILTSAYFIQFCQGFDTIFTRVS